MKKNLLLTAFLVACMYVLAPAQVVTGVYRGKMQVDSPRYDVNFELTLKERNGKLTGYCYRLFILGDTLYYNLVRVNARIVKDMLVVEDEKSVSNNFAESRRGIKTVFFFKLTDITDTAQVLPGEWSLNQWRGYTPLTGKVEVQRERNYLATQMYQRLAEKNLDKEMLFDEAPLVLASNKKPPTQQPATSQPVTTAQPVAANNKPAANNPQQPATSQPVTTAQPVAANNQPTANNTQQPATSQPVTTAQPVAANNQPTANNTQQPATSQPVTTAQPVAANNKPAANNTQQPATSQPVTTAQPVAANNKPAANATQQPATSQPVTTAQPVAANNKPAINATQQPATSQPVTTSQPVAANNKPAANNTQQPATSQPVTTSQPVAANNKPAANNTQQPATSQPVTTAQPVAPNPSVAAVNVPVIPVGQQPANPQPDLVVAAPTSTRDSVKGKLPGTPIGTPPVITNPIITKRVTELQQTLTVYEDTITLSLYDNGEIDGDTVSVFLNNEILVSKVGLSASAYKIQVPVARGQILQLTLYAENLGRIPPNTGLLVVYSGEQRYQIFFSSSLEKSAVILLRREEEP